MRSGTLQRVAQARQVAQEELVLQALGGGADQRPRDPTAAAARGRRRSCRRRCPPRPPAPRARSIACATRAASRSCCARGTKPASLRASGPSAANARATAAARPALVGSGRRAPTRRARARRSPASTSGSRRLGRIELRSRGCAIWSRSSRRRFFSRRSASSSPGWSTAIAVDQAVEIGMLDAQLDQPALRRMQVVVHCVQRLRAESGRRSLIYRRDGRMSAATPVTAFSAATGMHRGDRAYQQDQVEIIAHPRVRAACWPCWPTAWAARAAGARPPTR